MRNYRDKFDIIADILEIAKKNPKKTQIMYQANLSYKVLQKYLEKIIKSNLVSFHEQNHCYTLTTKGQSFLDKYQVYDQSNKTIEKQLSALFLRKKALNQLCLVE
jgi:predicted transcriptional regulator